MNGSDYSAPKLRTAPSLLGEWLLNAVKGRRECLLGKFLRVLGVFLLERRRSVWHHLSYRSDKANSIRRACHEISRAKRQRPGPTFHERGESGPLLALVLRDDGPVGS
jgi:hypothetical protein